MGIRSLLETVMIEKVGDSGTIGTNVTKFIAEGYIAPKHEGIFRLQIEAGHAGMHRKYRAGPGNLHRTISGVSA
jgi:hypothetical protein